MPWPMAKAAVKDAYDPAVQIRRARDFLNCTAISGTIESPCLSLHPCFSRFPSFGKEFAF